MRARYADQGYTGSFAVSYAIWVGTQYRVVQIVGPHAFLTGRHLHELVAAEVDFREPAATDRIGDQPDGSGLLSDIKSIFRWLMLLLPWIKPT